MRAPPQHVSSTARLGVPTQGRYREAASALQLHREYGPSSEHRERMEDGNTRAVSTLNGTLATTRWLVAILENHQQKDGSIEIPKAMRPYMGSKGSHRADQVGSLIFQDVRV